MQFILKHSNTVYSITTTADVYSVNEPDFFITFKNMISLQQAKQFIFNLFPDNSINKEVSIRTLSYSPIYSGYYATFTKNYFRIVVDKLYQHGILTVEERSNIENHIIEFEQIVDNRCLVAREINKAQIDAIQFMVAPYIENLLTLEDKYILLTLMARSMLKCISNLGKDGDDLIFTQNKVLLENIKKSLPDIKQREDIYLSIGAIAKLFSGSQEMISTFLKLGKNIPDKKIQCDIIRQEMYDAFNRKCNLGGCGELKLISYLALSGYNRHIDNINWDQPQEALRKFINSINNKKNYDSDFIFQYYQNKVVSDIRNAMVAIGVGFDQLNLIEFVSPEQLQAFSCPVAELKLEF